MVRLCTSGHIVYKWPDCVQVARLCTSGQIVYKWPDCCFSHDINICQVVENCPEVP